MVLKLHTLTEAQLPHRHTIGSNDSTADLVVRPNKSLFKTRLGIGNPCNTSFTGSGQAHTIVHHILLSICGKGQHSRINS